MITAILSLVVSNLVLLGVIIWLTKEYHDQQKKLIKAILSKDVIDFTNSEVAEEIAAQPEKKEVSNDDMVDVDTISDEQFNKMIKNSMS